MRRSRRPKAARCAIAPYVIKRVGVISTLLPGLAPKVVDKTLKVTAERLAPAGCHHHRRAPRAAR